MPTDKKFVYKLGIGLLIFSMILWLIPVMTPFFPISTKLKAGIITSVLIIAEIIFWIGALLVGKEAAAKFKSYLNPKTWKKEKNKQ